eukprot:6185381-Pleurochrysis_carterae.AAC.2
MHESHLGGGRHSGKRVINVLMPSFIQAQQALGRRIMHGNKRAEGGIIGRAQALGLGGGASSEVERVAIACHWVLDACLTLWTLEATPKLVKVDQLEDERGMDNARAVDRRLAHVAIERVVEDALAGVSIEAAAACGGSVPAAWEQAKDRHWHRRGAGVGAGTAGVSTGAEATGASGNGAAVATEDEAPAESGKGECAREKPDPVWSLSPSALKPCSLSSKLFSVGGLCTFLSLSYKQPVCIKLVLFDCEFETSGVRLAVGRDVQKCDSAGKVRKGRRREMAFRIRHNVDQAPLLWEVLCERKSASAGTAVTGQASAASLVGLSCPYSHERKKGVYDTSRVLNTSESVTKLFYVTIVIIVKLFASRTQPDWVLVLPELSGDEQNGRGCAWPVAVRAQVRHQISCSTPS